MIPADGWIEVGLEAELVSFPLPIPHTFTYRDNQVFGRARQVITRTRGAAQALLTSSARNLAVTVELHDAYDVILVDRIE